MVAAEITSTVAGVSRTVRPRREALSATALVLSGVCAVATGTTGFGAAGAVAGLRAVARRAPWPARPVGLAGLRDGSGDVTSTGGSGSRSCCARAAGISAAANDVRAAEANKKRRGRARRTEDMVRDLGMTSVARHSERGLTLGLSAFR